MKKEFNLSEKIVLRPDDTKEGRWFWAKTSKYVGMKNIKEFIRRLKKKLLNYQYQTNPQLNEYCYNNIIKQIRKLAGDDLI